MIKVLPEEQNLIGESSHKSQDSVPGITEVLPVEMSL